MTWQVSEPHAVHGLGVWGSPSSCCFKSIPITAQRHAWSLTTRFSLTHRGVLKNTVVQKCSRFVYHPDKGGNCLRPPREGFDPPRTSARAQQLSNCYYTTWQRGLQAKQKAILRIFLQPQSVHRKQTANRGVSHVCSWKNR